MRPEWSDAEKGEAAGIAHRAAFLTVCPEPEGGWRNSYDVSDEPELAAAHTAAHRAIKAICGQCPVRQPCLSYALALGPSLARGIYGGTTERKRDDIRRNRRRAS